MTPTTTERLRRGRRPAACCKYGHDLEQHRRRCPGGGTYCRACKVGRNQGRERSVMVKHTAVMRQLLRDGLMAPDAVWQRRVFRFFEDLERGAAAEIAGLAVLE